MARPSEETKAQILAEYHAGVSQRQLALNHNVSSATVNKLCKGVTPKNASKVNALVSVNIELSKQSEREVNAVIKEVNDEVAFRLRSDRDLQAIQDKGNSMIDSLDSPQGVLALMTATVRHREARLGKSPDTAIQINTSSAQVITASEVKRIRAQLDDEC